VTHRSAVFVSLLWTFMMVTIDQPLPSWILAERAAAPA
jgi:hypothetical protein